MAFTTFPIDGAQLQFTNYAKEMEEWEEEDDILLQLYVSNTTIISQYIEEEDQPVRKRHRGSIPGHKVIDRQREVAHARLWNDYFSENPTFCKKTFRRRFRMRRELFLKIVNAVKGYDSFFVQKRDGLGRLGLSSLQKVTSAFRILAYGTPADGIDENFRIGESTSILCVKKFCKAMVELFGKQYLRSPNTSDIANLLKVGEDRGFPGMLGSLDCMHWAWKNCPRAWAGQYSGRSGTPTLILEAVASYDLWIWHAYFGLPGSNNDINVLHSSNLFANLTQGIAPPACYTIQGKEYDTGYYLADGIYPKWSTLVQTISQPQGPKKQHFAMMQESRRKDVERAFGVLQARFAIVKGPARFWKKRVLHDIMSACIIMHNMIIEDERDPPPILDDEIVVDETEPPIPDDEIGVDEANRFQCFLAKHKELKNKEAHFALRNALVEHLWERHGNSA